MEKFYEVVYNGAIVRHNIHKKDWYFSTIITRATDSDYRIVDDREETKKGLASLFTEDVIQKGINDGIYFTTLDSAKKASEKLWDDFFAPNDKWVVVSIFDNREESIISPPLSKSEAKRELSKCYNSIYTKYSIRKA